MPSVQSFPLVNASVNTCLAPLLAPQASPIAPLTSPPILSCSLSPLRPFSSLEFPEHIAWDINPNSSPTLEDPPKATLPESPQLLSPPPPGLAPELVPELSPALSPDLSPHPSPGLSSDPWPKSPSTRPAARLSFRLISSQSSPQPSFSQLLRALPHALRHNQLTLHYQPIVNLKTGKITTLEALLRWEHPDWGNIGPARFIPWVERSPLMQPLGDWILHTALAQMQQWQQQGLTNVTLALNLSPSQLLPSGYFLEQLRAGLHHFAIAPTQLKLEITETLALAETTQTRDSLTQLVDLGIELALDDFGTGYASLSSLKQYPFQSLKLDQSFIRGLQPTPHSNGTIPLDTHTKTQTIVAAMIHLSHTLNLKVVAEGVETATQQELLKSLNCDSVQGYYYSRPVCAESATLLLQRQHLRPCG